jgi:hypothetical protein
LGVVEGSLWITGGHSAVGDACRVGTPLLISGDWKQAFGKIFHCLKPKVEIRVRGSSPKLRPAQPSFVSVESSFFRIHNLITRFASREGPSRIDHRPTLDQIKKKNM